MGIDVRAFTPWCKKSEMRFKCTPRQLGDVGS